jgi:hypothetical protein
MLGRVTRSTRSIVATLLGAVTLSGCGAAVPAAAPVLSSPTPGARVSLSPAHSKPSPAHSSKGHPSKGARTTPAVDRTTPPGARIVRFRIAQHPKCAEGTAVFRAPAVPLVIEWQITGATRGALSVDDPTHTPGTYGPVKLEGSEEFTFTCAGDVGSTETHTYAIYTVGGGPQRSATLTASAKILDKGR